MKQPWIKSARFDGLFILTPPFLALLVVIVLPDRYKSSSDMPLIGWVLLIILVDVAHVYSTLFRTYFNQSRFQRQRLLFLTVPLVCYLVGVLLHSLNGLWFWRVLAYLAVFHFIRQQYGFLRIYSRAEHKSHWTAQLDAVTIYAATLYPLVWWHLTPNRHFNWFVEGDFWQGEVTGIKPIITGVYGLLLLLYVGKEIWYYRRTGGFNWPRNLLVIGTALSWYFGIVQFNGDLAFTALNVLSHGIPYMALIWVSDRSHSTSKMAHSASFLGLSLRSWPIFLGFLVVLAYLEEGLWDGFVWREHSSVFGLFQTLPIVTNAQVLALLVPLLALPQMTHYVLDGFIWRRNHTHETIDHQRPSRANRLERS